jgi:hypothetical protein
MAAGRLTLAEYDERLSRAYAATTFGELAALTADLPSPAATSARAVEDIATTPMHSFHGSMGCGRLSGRATPPPSARHGSDSEQSWRAWLATSVAVLVVYLVVSLVSWEFSYFWPMWVIGPWGAVLLADRVGGRRTLGEACGRVMGRRAQNFP